MELIEVEVKYKVEEIESILKKLEEMNAKIEEEVIEEDHYFNHPCRDFKNTDEALRIRIRSNSIELTYKGPKISNKTKSRIEVSVILNDSFDSILKLLEYLGFTKIAVVRKHRKVYKLGDYKISLDIVEPLGNFVEIELRTQKETLHDAELRVLELARKLGLKGKPILKSYLELLLEKELSTSR